MSYIFGTGAGAEPMAQLYSRAGAQNIGGQINALNQAAALHMKMKELQAQRDSEDKALGFQRDNADAQRNFQASESAANRNMQASQFGQDMGLKREGMAQHANEFGADLGLKKTAQDNQAAQFQTNNELEQTKVANAKAYNDGLLTLDQKKAADAKAEADARIGVQKDTLSEDQRRWNANPENVMGETVANEMRGVPAAPPKLMVGPDGNDSTSTTSTSGSISPGALPLMSSAAANAGESGAAGPAGAAGGTPFGGLSPAMRMYMQLKTGKSGDQMGESTRHAAAMDKMEEARGQLQMQQLDPNSDINKQQRDQQDVAAALKRANDFKMNNHQTADQAAALALSEINPVRMRRGVAPLSVSDLQIMDAPTDLSPQGRLQAAQKAGFATPEDFLASLKKDVVGAANDARSPVAKAVGGLPFLRMFSGIGGVNPDEITTQDALSEYGQPAFMKRAKDKYNTDDKLMQALLQGAQ